MARRFTALLKIQKRNLQPRTATANAWSMVLMSMAAAGMLLLTTSLPPSLFLCTPFDRVVTSRLSMMYLFFLNP
jgi:hypothetical protein